jgi:hypothetical protein
MTRDQRERQGRAEPHDPATFAFAAGALALTVARAQSILRATVGESRAARRAGTEALEAVPCLLAFLVHRLHDVVSDDADREGHGGVDRKPG